MSTAANGGFAVLAAIALHLWLFNDSAEPPQLAKKFSTTYDYIVVGAGAAGCVVASRLSEDKNVTVLLLEAGEFDDHLPQIIVPRLGPLVAGSRLDWQYQTEPQNGLFTGHTDGRINWPRGRVMGGTSSMNSMIYVRGSRYDYDRWAEYTKDDRWSYKKLLPYFKISEGINIPELQKSAYHGRDGPLIITRVTTEKITHKLIEAGQTVGYPYNEDYNGGTMEGITYTQATVSNGERINIARAFIHPNLDRPNLHVAVGSQVTKVIIKDKKAVGVEVIRDSRRYIVNARREVILSAGAIGSPHILMLSGVGPKGHLESLKIPVETDLPVGQNLHNHPMFEIGVSVREPLSTPRSDIVTLWTKLQYAMFRSGPLPSPMGAELMIFKSTGKELIKDWPDTQIFFRSNLPAVDSFGYYSQETQAELDGRNKAVYGFSCLPTMMRPESRGNITLRSANPFDYPILQANYLDKQEDVETLIRGIHECEKLVASKPLQDIGAAFTDKGTESRCKQHKIDSHEYWECLVKHRLVTMNHQVGTCKMGPKGDPTTVVDSELRVQGISGLRVADASIMPWVVSGNTYAAAIVIGERVVDFIKGNQLPSLDL